MKHAVVSFPYKRVLLLKFEDSTKLILPVRSSTFSVTSISIDFQYQSILIVGLNSLPRRRSQGFVTKNVCVGGYGLNRLISMISTDFLYRFLSMSYVWYRTTLSEWLFNCISMFKTAFYSLLAFAQEKSYLISALEPLAS